MKHLKTYEHLTIEDFGKHGTPIIKSEYFIVYQKRDDLWYVYFKDAPYKDDQKFFATIIVGLPNSAWKNELVVNFKTSFTEKYLKDFTKVFEEIKALHNANKYNL